MTEDMTRLLARWLACLGAVAIAWGLAGCTRPPEQTIEPAKAYTDALYVLKMAAEPPDMAGGQDDSAKALSVTSAPIASPSIVQGLRDAKEPVQFAAMITAGDLRVAAAKPILLDRLRDEQMPPSLLCAALYALHRLGDDNKTSELGRLLHDDLPQARADAALVMGKMGEPSAIGPLKALQMDDHDPKVQLQVVDSLARLGDEASADSLEAFTKSQFLEDRLVAVQAMGAVKNARSILVLKKMFRGTRQDPAVRIAASASLAMLGEPAGTEPALQAALDPAGVLRAARPKDAEIRGVEVVGLQTLALVSLGRMGDPALVQKIHPLLSSQDGKVRVAAAKAILELLKGQPLTATPKATSRPALPPAKTGGEPTVVPVTAPAPTSEPAGTPSPLRTSGGKD